MGKDPKMQTRKKLAKDFKPRDVTIDGVVLSVTHEDGKVFIEHRNVRYVCNPDDQLDTLGRLSEVNFAGLKQVLVEAGEFV